MAPARRPSAVYRKEYQSLLKLVREARLDAGLTQKDVARALGRHVSFVSKFELGERRLDPLDLKDLAELYDKPIEFFYGLPKRRKPRKPRGKESIAK